MGWNGLMGRDGEGRDATWEARQKELDEKNRQFEAERYANRPVTPPPVTMKERVEETMSEFTSDKEAQDAAELFLMKGEEQGILPRMMEVLKAEGLLEVADVRMQAASLEAAYRMFC